MGKESEARAAMLQWLNDRHEAIARLEDEGARALAAEDAASYRRIMREKAVTLSLIAEHAQERLAALPAPEREALAQELARFAAGARTALELDSVFYMSALLYPDDHKPGQPDNLARCIEKFKNAARGER